jgi:hypothetical protein
MNTQTATTSGHLTEDQIDDALIGDLCDTAAEHLAACESCTTLFAEAQSPLTSFRTVSIAWSERHSATLPQPSFSNAARPQRTAWGVAAASAVLALMAAVPGMQRHANESANNAAVTVNTGAEQVAAVTTPAMASTIQPSISNDEQITQDNQMLKAIDHELDASAEDPAMLGLQPMQSTGHYATTSVRD